ncbi:MAG: hypothetical protein K9N06_14220, partial [Candidatus Cloacimonetes bacterium]|nr:hypothetical protein [Candidatus Cloacimonadota bacterium]
MKHLRSFAVLIFLLLTASVYSAPDWTIVSYPGLGTNYGGNVSIDSVLTNSEDLVGAFVGDECRFVDHPNDSGFILGTIVGTAGVSATVTFRIWDASNDVICDVSATYEAIFDDDNLYVNIDGVTPGVTDSEITIGNASVNQVTDFTVGVESYQGIAVNWSINEIEFEVHFDNSLIAFSNVITTGTLAAGDSVSVTDHTTYITVNITTLSTFSGLDPVIELVFSPLGSGGSSPLDLQNMIYTDTSTAAYNITNLVDGTATITYENFLPFLIAAIPDQPIVEDFDPVDINLNNYFNDENGYNDISYHADFTETEITVSVTDSILTLTPIPDWNGSTDVVVTATDTYFEAISDTFTVIISPVNDAPVIVLPDSFTFAEDGSLEVDFSIYVSDVDEDALILSVSGNDSIIVVIDGLDVTFSAMANWNSSEILTFTVNDIEVRATASDDVEVIVTPVNDAPEITDYSPTGIIGDLGVEV